MKFSKPRLVNLDRRGVSLVELMVSLSLFAVVLGVVFSVMIGSKNSYNDTRERVQYQQSMRAVLSLISRDVRSTGCDPNEVGIDRFSTATATQMRCQMDLNGDSDFSDVTPDEDITYAFDAVTGELSRDNTSGALVILRDLTNMSFTYFDVDGAVLGAFPLNATDRDLVRQVEISIQGVTDRGEPVGFTTRVYVRNG